MSQTQISLQIEFILVSLEGNIGAGKTTLLNLLRESYPDALFLDEPLNNWQNINGDSTLNLLELYYTKPHRWGFTFQMYAYQTRLMEWCRQKEEYLQRTQQPAKKILVFTERSLESDKKIFLENAKLLNLVSDIEYQLYHQLYNFNTEKLSPFSLRGAIYLNLPAESCLERLRSRSRFEEIDSIKVEYLEQLNSRHQEWLIKQENQFQMLTIDSLKDYKNEGLERQQIIIDIQNFIMELCK